MEDIEELALVLVDSLDLTVEQRVDIDLQAVILEDVPGQVLFCGRLDLLPVGPEAGVSGKRAESLQLVKVSGPAVADCAGDQSGKSRVGLFQPAPLGDAVGLVIESFRVHFIKIAEQFLLQDIGVQGSHPVDGEAADNGQVRHPYLPFPVLFNDRHPLDSAVITGKMAADFQQKSFVDFIDDDHMARQNMLEEPERPFFQCFRENGVVGVGKSLPGNLPGFIPGELFLIDQNPH